MSSIRMNYQRVAARLVQSRQGKDAVDFLKRHALIILLLVLGTGLRFYQLGSRSFWIDEVITAQYQRPDTLIDVLQQSNKYWDTMPLPAVLTWALQGLGESEAAIRAPYAIAGILTILALYKLGATFFRPRVGLCAAYFSAVLPLSVWYGQEARPYTLVMLLSTLQMLLAYQVAIIGKKRSWVALTIVSIVSLYTHYLMLAPTAAVAGFIGLHLLVDSRRIRAQANSISTQQHLLAQWRAAKVCGVGVILAYTPWIGRLLFFVAGGRGGTGRLTMQSTFTLTGIQGLLGAYDLTGFLLISFILGLLTLALLPRGRIPGSV